MQPPLKEILDQWSALLWHSRAVFGKVVVEARKDEMVEFIGRMPGLFAPGENPGG